MSKFLHDEFKHKQVDRLNGVLCCLQHHLSHTIFAWFHEYQAGALNCLAKGYSHLKPADPVQVEHEVPR